MGSTKDIIDISEQPTETEPGEATFWFKEFPDPEGIPGGTFSVRDWGIMPNEQLPDLIPYKGSVQCMIAALLFEYLADAGVPSHYLGVVNKDGKVVSVSELDEPVNKMRIMLSRSIKPVFNPKLPNCYDYSFFTDSRGELKNYVVPMEFIYRNALPDGSSKRKAILEAHARGDDVSKALKDLGLTEVPFGKETVFLPRPFNEYTTKYEADDRNLGDDKNDLNAYQISGLTRDEFEAAKNIRNLANEGITDFYEVVSGQTGYPINHLDGKIEIVKFRRPELGDTAGTLDEIRAEVIGLQVSKEPLRQWYDKFAKEWSNAIKKAKSEYRQRGIEDWKAMVGAETLRLDGDYRKLVGEMYQSFANLVTRAHLGRDFFNARPIEVVVPLVHSYLK